MLNPSNPASTPGAPVQAPRPPASDASTDETTLSQETLARRLFRFDMVLLALVLVLAFFLGSFVASSTELYLYLALANPFAGDPDASSWPHHAWLPSLLLRTFYEPGTDTAEIAGICVVVAKALVVVALAVILCLTRRPDQSWLLPVVCTALAVLVLSQRLFLQPFVLSLLFLAVTMWILTLPPSRYPRAIWWLPVLFIVWVNMDQWFVLGPITVALYLAGQWLQRRFQLPQLVEPAAEPARLKQLGLVLLVGLAVCLINPWTYRAFTLPMELAHLVVSTVNVLPEPLVAAGGMVRKVQDGDPTFLQRYSPLAYDYWSRPSLGKNAAGLAYFVLLVLGIASFVVPMWAVKLAAPAGKTTRVALALPLLLVFVVFALLSLWTNRLVPLFAVVAGPIVVLNFQDHLRRRAAGGPMVGRAELNWAVGVRGAALLVAVVLIACAWPGWLHGNAENFWVSRHVAWSIAEDPGIEKAAATLTSIQKYGKEHGQPNLLKLGVNYGLDGGNQILWTNHHGWPGINLLCDSRYGLYDGERGEAFGKIRKGLREEAALRAYEQQTNSRLMGNQQTAFIQARKTYQEALRRLGSDYVVLTNLHRDTTLKTQTIARTLHADPMQWTLLYHDGRTAVFGWRDPNRRDDPFAAVRLDLAPLAPAAAFPPNVPTVTLKAGVPAVPRGPRSDWDQFLLGPVPPPLSTFESAAYLEHYQASMQFAQRGFQALLSEAGGAAAQAGKRSVASFDLIRDLGPPGAVLAALRAARNGVLESPEEAMAHLQLADACGRCFEQENRWTGQQPPLADYKPATLRARLRYIELFTAMHHVLLLQPPTSWLIHKHLSEHYGRLNYLDLTVEHLSQARDPGEGKFLPAFKEDLKRRHDEFKQAAAGQSDPIARFQLALYRINPEPKDPLGRDKVQQRGLVQLGLKILSEADPKKLEGPQLATLVSWQLFLMLMTGQAEAVRQAHTDNLSNSENLRKSLPPGEYDELQGLAAAALGDYPAADRFLMEAEKAYQLPPDDKIVSLEQQAMRQLVGIFTATAGWIPGEDGLFGPPTRLTASLLQQEAVYKDLGELAQPRTRVADIRLVRGLLALEAGNRATALKHFQDSLRIGPVVLHALMPDRPIARRYVELLEGK
jgi:tetratricopeptide (TPR) repeat protein